MSIRTRKMLLQKVIIAVICAVASTTEIPDYQDLQEHHHVELKKPIIPILKQSFDQSKEGYHFSYETGNGIHAQEHGYFKNKGDEKHETLVQQGSYTYHDEHGHPITVTYIADEHGFQPQGAHFPTPPPIPEEIQKSLQEISHEEPAQEEYPHQHYVPLEGHQFQ